ncbi:uncharacterized protein DSM5745_06816 [Aspergillus mulundensis]|uniref:Uncharacterized protein n=1 Tax=Aspergillus mulundensis TaxID=1810919 RepID=A0A3D8RSH1_9EURO|nr:hypothetical protein DSM5745_06816 [Aspergillus mulundensis]RDW76824.1 hypothetical protein DSM5745_06816 [Aspergillus mulundensis]
MPMTWTPEANAKLFLGVLEQLRETNVKLSYKRLAEYMGADCTPKSIDNQMQKLRKQAGAGAAAATATATATAAAAAAPGADSELSAPATPSTSAKRTATPTETPHSKKRRAKPTGANLGVSKRLKEMYPSESDTGYSE